MTLTLTQHIIRDELRHRRAREIVELRAENADLRRQVEHWQAECHRLAKASQSPTSEDE